VNLLKADMSFEKYGKGLENQNDLDQNFDEEATESLSNEDTKKQHLVSNYKITINGPGTSFVKEIFTVDDFDVISAVLKSVKSSFLENPSKE
jgi:hypothetical protein